LLNFGKLNLGPALPLTMVAGVVTITGSYHSIFTAATANLNSINGGVEGDLLVIRPSAGSGDISARDNTGNLRLAGNFTLSDPADTMVLLFDGANWIELARANNA
jgi:hypothetical protein